MLVFVFLWACSYSLLAYKNFKWALLLLIVLLPTYLIRFNLGPLPSTLLELTFGLLFLVWLVRHAFTDWPRLKKFVVEHRLLTAALGIFFASSVASIFVSDMWYYSFGQWRAYFLEPLLLFVVLIGRNYAVNDLVLPLGLSTISIATFAIIQKFSGWTLPDDGRVTSFFTSPNAVGLYLGPIVMILLAQMITTIDKNNWRTLYRRPESWLLVLNGLAIVLTRSLGTLVGLAGGTFVLLLALGKRRLTLGLTLLAVVVCLAVPPVRELIASKDRSSANRVVLWQYSWEFLSASPKNFIGGTGIRQFFRKIQKPHYDPKKMERLIYPHNIALNFWTETGLFGMLSFITIFGVLFSQAIRLYKSNRAVSAVLIATLVTFVVHGLIDVPYFKNDLAMLFWILASLVLTAAPL